MYDTQMVPEIPDPDQLDIFDMVFPYDEVDPQEPVAEVIPEISNDYELSPESMQRAASLSHHSKKVAGSYKKINDDHIL